MAGRSLPPVSIAFALRGDFAWSRLPGYIGVQLLGATLACLFLLVVFGNVDHLGATLPGSGVYVAGPLVGAAVTAWRVADLPDEASAGSGGGALLIPNTAKARP